jgi:hypothetical protein
MLYTSIDLFDALIALGANPSNIFLIGKHYSSCQEVERLIRLRGIKLLQLEPLNGLASYADVFNKQINELWRNAIYHSVENQITGFIVLDDGGRCLEMAPYDLLKDKPIFGIEQTTAGIFAEKNFSDKINFINVATSAVKKFIEPFFIIDAIIKKLTPYLIAEKNILFGIVGSGVIGAAIIKKLKSLKSNIIIYDKNINFDKNDHEIKYATSISELINRSYYILGCTGSDITENINFEEVIYSNKIFISCTSEDKEFLTLLKYVQSKKGDFTNDPLMDINFRLNASASITILRGGFPINFDNSGESVPKNNIQLTRGLLLSSIIQALYLLPKMYKTHVAGRIMLEPNLQKFIVDEWFSSNKDTPISTAVIENFNSVEWIAQNSSGQFIQVPDILTTRLVAANTGVTPSLELS